MKRVFLLGLSLFTAGFLLAQSHGLEFASYEVVQENRTSLDLTPTHDICIEKETEISFSLTFQPNLVTYFGYIVRIMGQNNIDLIYHQKEKQINFVVGEKCITGIGVDSLGLLTNWNIYTIQLNKKNNTVGFLINGAEKAVAPLDLTNSCIRIVFGANNYMGYQTVDVPPILLKDVKVKAGNRTILNYPLDELNGDTIYDGVSKKMAVVKNPGWIKPRYQNWKHVFGGQLTKYASVAFDDKRAQVLLTGEDSLVTYSLLDEEAKVVALKQVHNMPAGNQTVYNPYNDVLYNFYIDEKVVSAFDSVKQEWTKKFLGLGLVGDSLTVFWQANKFISPLDSSLYVFGGYGQMQYKNLIQRYHIPTQKWDTIEPAGDFFMPRYLSALGANKTKDTLFIVGGYGSNTGNQTINPKYSYEILAYSIRNHSFKVISTLKNTGDDFCFANSLVLDPQGSEFYGLVYPRGRYNAGLQLLKGNLQTGEFRLVADSLPYFFYDIETFADLFYSDVVKKLVAVTLVNNKTGYTDYNIYTLDFPPNLGPVVPDVVTESRKTIWLILLVTLMGGTLWLVRKHKGKKEKPDLRKTVIKAELKVPKPDLPLQEDVRTAIKEPEKAITIPDKSAVFLFGQMEILDKTGANITAQFTPLLKELFSLILIHTYRDAKGITPEALYEIIWSDKSTKDAKNNYHVNIGKLKVLLEKMGSINIGKDGGNIRAEILNNDVSVDYGHFCSLISQKTLNKSDIIELCNISGRGGFLNQFHYHWLDDLRSEISGNLMDALIKNVEHQNLDKDPELLVKIANTIFIYDLLNEEALSYKCRGLILMGRHGLAKDAYDKFSKEYKESYGQNFEKTFAQITS